MGEDCKSTWTPLELADYLHNLAEQLRRGALMVQGRSWSVPEHLEVRQEFKEKKGRLLGRLSWSWSTLKDYDPAARQEVGRWEESLKSVKKRLGAAFKEVQRQAGQDGFPEDHTLADFLAASRAFAAMAEPEWQGGTQTYLDHLASLQHAVQARQREAVLHELRDLQASMAACHREFKSRAGAGK